MLDILKINVLEYTLGFIYLELFNPSGVQTGLDWVINCSTQ